jgi:hypothetical protein
VLVDGEAVAANVTCALSGLVPDCEEAMLQVELAALPAAGDHTIQLGTPGGLLSNEVLLIVAP